MKSGLDFYKKDTVYRMIRVDLEAQYGNLPGVLFERTQTLGTGGSCCDFHFKVERRN